MSQTEVQLIKNGAVVDADINGMSSSKLSGALPAISGAALTGITSAGKAHNLVINGAMRVAQRGTSSTTSGIHTVDRIGCDFGGADENPTQEQVDVAAGTTPYSLGFRKAFKITNGNQTSGAGASDYVRTDYKIEAQDVATSGWNYTSSSSNITLSFWVKSSVSKDFNFLIHTTDGTAKLYPMTTGTLSADTWTKITKTIPGVSSLTFDNNNGTGIIFQIYQYLGTTYTAGSVTNNQWQNYSSTEQTPDQTTTWWTTNNATFELTGVQLEVGDSATDFEHLSFADDLRKCQRYCYTFNGDGSQGGDGQTVLSENGTLYNASAFFCSIEFKVTMRAKPTMSVTTGTNYYVFYSNNSGVDVTGSAIAMNGNTGTEAVAFNHNGTTLGTSGHSALFRINNTSAKIIFSAEL